MQQEKSETHRKKARKNGKARLFFQRAEAREKTRRKQRKKLAWPLRRHVPSTRPTDFSEELVSCHTNEGIQEIRHRDHLKQKCKVLPRQKERLSIRNRHIKKLRTHFRGMLQLPKGLNFLFRL